MAQMQKLREEKAMVEKAKKQAEKRSAASNKDTQGKTITG